MTIVEKIAIVRNQDQRAGVAVEPFLEPDDGVEVEVVGRLVEQQQVRAAHQRPRQIEAHAPAAGELGDRALEVFVGETQAMHQRRRACRRGVAVDLGKARMQEADLLAGVMVVVMFFRRDQIAFDLAQLGVAVEHEVERGIGQRRRVLGDVGQHPVGRPLQVAAVGMQFAAQEAEKGRLAAAVGAGQADLPARMQLQGGAGDQCVAVAGKTEIT